jgi:hypothetical protein
MRFVDDDLCNHLDADQMEELLLHLAMQLELVLPDFVLVDLVLPELVPVPVLLVLPSLELQKVWPALPPLPVLPLVLPLVASYRATHVGSCHRQRLPVRMEQEHWHDHWHLQHELLESALHLGCFVRLGNLHLLGAVAGPAAALVGMATSNQRWRTNRNRPTRNWSKNCHPETLD